MKKEVFLVIIFLSLFPLASAQVMINEVMYAPTYTWGGTSNEWIELYNPTDNLVNLNGWNLSEMEGNVEKKHPIPNTTIPSHGYLILARDRTKFLNYYNIPSQVLEVSFGSGLNNDGDTITIYNESEQIVSSLSYSYRWGAYKNNKSLEKINPLGQNNQENWNEGIVYGGTPDTQNSLFGTCDLDISILANQIWQVVNDSVVVSWTIEVKNNTEIIFPEEFNFTFSYWIEDEYGEIVKDSYFIEDNETKTFGPYQKTFHNEDAGDYIIFANLTQINCTDLITNNNLDNDAIIVKGEQQQGNQQSSISMEEAPENATFGDIIDVKINIYRGDTGKYAVYARIEKENGDDVSEETTLHVLTKYVNYSVKIPVQIKLNCNDKYPENDYKIIIEGLGINADKEIKLSGKSSLCPEEQVQENKTEEKIPEEENESISSNSENSEQSLLAGDVIYSKGATTLKITPYLLSLLCLFIAFYTIKKNGQRN